MRDHQVNDAPALWTPEEFARFARLTLTQVAHLRRTGKGPTFTKFGREIRYVPGNVRRWIAENERQTSKESS
ncbi:hypothetical protein [Arthrobacter sp. HLT1-21]